ncbi:tail fiber domain-containing protein [Brevundimonas aurantiaca]|uniref:tail fiber domain-containing protein n=1 Tax=Brevundimonas aurantiaca TaxID=74316 RepID=UPI002FDDF3C0
MSTAQERLQQGYYNSAAVSGANPGGLASGGHVQNFPAALADIGTVAQTVGAQSAAAVGAAGSALSAAASAHDDRVLAQQAAQAAGQFDPTTKVSKSGDVMSGPLSVGGPSQDAALINPGAAGRSGAVEFRIGGLKTGYLGFADANWNYIVAENGRGWSLQGAVVVNGYSPFTLANDGSGSGLDADMVRGVIPHHDANPSTMVTRDGNGYAHCRGYVIEPGSGEDVYWGGNGARISREGTELKCNKSMYFDGWVSASEVRQRSDRRLKSKIEPLEGPLGRLIPVRYVLNATGQTMVGFIAQDVERVRKEAVWEGAGEAAQIPGERPLLELDAMALIAHLTAQVNALQDRIDAAGI